MIWYLRLVHFRYQWQPFHTWPSQGLYLPGFCRNLSRAQFLWYDVTICQWDRIGLLSLWSETSQCQQTPLSLAVWFEWESTCSRGRSCKLSLCSQISWSVHRWCQRCGKLQTSAGAPCPTSRLDKSWQTFCHFVCNRVDLSFNWGFSRSFWWKQLGRAWLRIHRWHFSCLSSTSRACCRIFLQLLRCRTYSQRLAVPRILRLSSARSSHRSSAADSYRFCLALVSSLLLHSCRTDAPFCPDTT